MDETPAVALERPAGAVEPPPPGPAGRPEGLRWLGVALLSLLVGIVTASVVGAVALAATGTTSEPGRSLPLTVAFPSQLGLWLGLVGVPAAYLVRRRRPVLATLGLRFRARDLPLGIGVGFASTLGVGALYLLVLSDDAQRKLDDPARQAVGNRSGLAAVALVVLLCVLTPLAEELFFRGFVFPAFRAVTNPVVGALVGGVVFGLVHFELLQLGGLALFGVVLCALAHRTGRLGAAVVAHATFNAITVIQLLSAPAA